MAKIKVFPGKVLIKMDAISVKQGNVWLTPKNKRNRNKGKVVKAVSKNIKSGDYVLFFSSKGIIMDELCLIEEKDIVLIFKKNHMLEPVNKRVLLIADPDPKETKSGIIIPEGFKEPPQTGVVLSVSADVEGYKEGERLLFERRMAMDISKYDDKKRNVLVIRASEIIAKL